MHMKTVIVDVLCVLVDHLCLWGWGGEGFLQNLENSPPPPPSCSLAESPLKLSRDCIVPSSPHIQDPHFDRIMATLVGSMDPGTRCVKDVILPGNN